MRKSPQFRIGNIVYTEDLSQERWTVDYLEDFNLIRDLITYFYPKTTDFDLSDILQLKNKNPFLFKVNSQFQRNERCSSP